MTLTKEALDLQWIRFDNAYVVYQPSSSETHIFNETTALILKSLEKGPLSLLGVTERVIQFFGNEAKKLVSGDLKFAIERLEELGLIEWPDNASTT